MSRKRWRGWGWLGCLLFGCGREPEPIAIWPLEAKPPYRRYVALGASDTEAAGASRFEAGYVYLFFQRWAEQVGGAELYALGRGGAVATDIVREQLPLARRLRPDLVTLWTGGNDVLKGVAPSTFERAFRRLLSVLTATGATVIVANLPHMERQPFAQNKSPAERDSLRERSTLFRRLIETVAAEFEVPVVHLEEGEGMYRPEHFTEDGFHPNDAGYAYIAERFWSVYSSL